MSNRDWNDDDGSTREPRPPGAEQAARPTAAPGRPLRSTLALLAGAFLLAIGLIVGFAATTSLSQPARPELGPTYAMTSLITQAALLVFGTLNVGAAAGIIQRKGWARRLGFVLAGFGLLVGAVFLIGPLSAFNVPLLDPLMIATLAVLAGYVLSLLGLIVGGTHFRPR